ncbi:hypothetical protein ACFY1B_46825 [Streptomyces mirabilis]|uniref:hypothetical protein n=1 Tax=Streptomyces mirabilis TaxID=68239 RepID=UPI00368F0BC8
MREMTAARMSGRQIGRESARHASPGCRERMVDLAGRRITIWGAAIKPEADDSRDSPALAVAVAVAVAVAHRLHELGAAVTVTAAQALDNARNTHPELD